MMTYRVFIFLATSLITTSAQASKKPKYFSDPQNLKVLPKDISPEELSETMSGFAMGLGLRCESCHVGEAGKSLTTFDFSSDEKPMKEKARIMMKMMNNINNELVPQLNTVEKDVRVDVRCVTCHRGQQKPLLIEDALQQAVDSGKPNAAVDKYRTLREKYYGSHTYDFSEFVLPMMAGNLLPQEKVGDAVELLKLNLEYFPESYFAHFSMARGYSAIGEKEKAIEHFEKALEINPNAGFIKKTIEQLKQ